MHLVKLIWFVCSLLPLFHETQHQHIHCLKVVSFFSSLSIFGSNPAATLVQGNGKCCSETLKQILSILRTAAPFRCQKTKKTKQLWLQKCKNPNLKKRTKNKIFIILSAIKLVRTFFPPYLNLNFRNIFGSTTTSNIQFSSSCADETRISLISR